MLNSKPFKFTPHCNCLIPLTAMSFKYIQNKVGESTSPCFTPDEILNQSVQILFTRTQADDLQFIDLLASYNFPYTSNWDINFYNNRSRFTQSNAFLISIKAQYVDRLSAFLFLIMEDKQYIWSVQLRPGLNPFCSSTIRSFDSQQKDNRLLWARNIFYRSMITGLYLCNWVVQMDVRMISWE